MDGKLKTIMLVALLVIIGGAAIYQTEKSKEAREKALAIQEAQEKAAQDKPVQKYVPQPSQATQVVGANSYSDAELLNIANENYAAYINSNNTYNFQSVISKSTNGNELTATFAATCNGNPQNITIDFKQVNNVVTIVGTEA